MLVPGLKTTLIVSVPVAGRLRVDVEHVVDAVDLLLDRRGDGLGDAPPPRRRGRSRVMLTVGGAISGYSAIGRPRCAMSADDRQDDRQDRREDRPVDEEVRQAHTA